VHFVDTLVVAFFFLLFVLIDFGFNIDEHVALRLLSPLGRPGL
jgi:hypothetical protein